MQISWLRKVDQLLQKKQLDKDDNISLSAHFTHLQYSVPHPPAISGLMPLFRDNAQSAAMVKHGMDVIMKAIGHVNPGQIPVLTLDQPLYTIAKDIQWSWPSMYGEEKYVVLMGGLHIEMVLLNVLGNCCKLKSFCKDIEGLCRQWLDAISLQATSGSQASRCCVGLLHC